MRLIALWARRHGQARGRGATDLVRFQNCTALRFPASQVQSIVAAPQDGTPPLPGDAAGLTAALRSGALGSVTVVPAFLGLTGAAGALPVHYTEQLAAHAASVKDEGPRAFLDMFSNRSLSLFYEGWRKYRMELRGEEGEGMLTLLLALAGLGSASLRRRLAGEASGGVLDESLGHFAAALRQRPASAVQMARVLSAYFDAPIRIDQFIGLWYAVPEAQQTRLGMQHCELGGGAMVGARVWQRDLRMRVVIGPLDHAAFASFLPGAAKARALAAWLALFTGASLEYEVQLVLRAEDVVGVTLGGAAAPSAGARLGWDSFLAPRAGGPDRGEVRYELMVA